MELNSFNVTVTDHGIPLEWSRPMSIDDAILLYKQYKKKYLHNKKGWRICSGENDPCYSTAYLEKRIREWKGSDIAIRTMFLLANFSVECTDGMKVELKHTSIT